METRRDLLKKAAMLTGAAAFRSMPDSIKRALAISPDPGTTFLDAEHIVILMQENRSFDHSLGTLRGVRGYNDPRAHVLPNGNPVWLQTNVDGEVFAPFRLDIKKTNVTWIGGLPHTWGNQVDARNDGAYDKWLIAKPSGYKGYAKKPMTLGHYTREDIPFYYALADAFTVCDQHFCSSLTGTTANRFYLWSGTVREAPHPDAKARLYNEEMDHGHLVDWPTFPERLEDAGVSWKFYQNEIDISTGLTGEEGYWLANFGCNPLEYAAKYNVRFSRRHRRHLAAREKAIPGEIADLEAKPTRSKDEEAKLTKLKNELKSTKSALAKWTEENWRKLSDRERSLHERAFVCNDGDPKFRELTTLTYDDAGTERTMKVPGGDIFHQFRKDVNEGRLPTVSWLVSPQSFSDHPSSAWFGAWYVSEVLDILTKNPEVWKKTIFILTYDENDGYYDHVPPFVAPNPYKPESGKVSGGIDARVEFVSKEQDLKFRPRYKPRESSIGLGYRVPLIVASPWSRGGCVCSEVFDHTSVLQFLESFLTNKTGKKVRESNISSWRRAVCGDLTSIFQSYDGQDIDLPTFVERDPFVESIHRARFKSLPTSFNSVSAEDAAEIRAGRKKVPNAGSQEPGTKRSCPLPYELYVDGGLSKDGSRLEVRFRVGDRRFGKRSAGSPFNVYSYRRTDDMQFRAYAVEPGSEVFDVWNLTDFADGLYNVRVDGPNGFMREFRGHMGEGEVQVTATYPDGARTVELALWNRGTQGHQVEVHDNAYGAQTKVMRLDAGQSVKVRVDASESKGWYDLSVRVGGSATFLRRLAGRVETGAWSVTDPAMG
ncbi:MAG: phospholipase C, phosphocholine-specific [Fimbriimonadaceae bacterium]|nr:phospholipase C, phosphocholine-specific [Fimbriimonadaceae bacterium]